MYHFDKHSKKVDTEKEIKLLEKNMNGFNFNTFSPKAIFGTILLIIFAGAITGYFIWKRTEEERTYKGATVEVDRVRKGSIDRKISAVGALTANQSVIIKPEVSGAITEILFKGGDSFQTGDPLVKIDERRYEAQLKEAKAKLNLAKINYERKKSLFEKSAAAQAKLDEAQSQLSVAEAEVDLAELKFSQTTVRAPFDGIAGIKMISVGDSVNEQKDLLSFVDVHPVKIDFKVPGNYVQLLSVGQTVVVYVDGFEGQKFDATIEEIDSRIDPQTHSLSVRASIPNERGLLKPGLFGRVELTAGTKDDTLLVPASAVDISGDEEYLYRITKRKGFYVAEKVPVTIGIRTEDTLEVVQGSLKEGDIIVTSGQVKIQDSSIVRPIGLVEEKSDDEEENKDLPKEEQENKNQEENKSKIKEDDSQKEEKQDAETEKDSDSGSDSDKSSEEDSQKSKSSQDVTSSTDQNAEDNKEDKGDVQDTDSQKEEKQDAETEKDSDSGSDSDKSSEEDSQKSKSSQDATSSTDQSAENNKEDKGDVQDTDSQEDKKQDAEVKKGSESDSDKVSKETDKSESEASENTDEQKNKKNNTEKTTETTDPARLFGNSPSAQSSEKSGDDDTDHDAV